MTASVTRGPDDRQSRPLWQYGVALVVVLAAVAGIVVWRVWFTSGACPADTREFPSASGHRCVGLSDGGHAFTRDLRHVSRLIKEENDTVTAGATAQGGIPYVTVVYAMTMRPGRSNTNSTASVRHELEGAYTAQVQANHQHLYGDSPRIRLLLAETGQNGTELSYTLDRIRARRDADRIVAVAGLGTSVTGTKEMAARLADEDIASFGAVLTADTLKKVRGLVRVAPPNRDEATAAVRFLSGKEYAKAKVLIVQDANRSDLYTRTLADTFGRRFPANRLAAGEPMQYDSSKSQLATYFTNQMANLCLAHPDVVYFAGRGRDLVDFVAPAASRTCKSERLTVLSGDDVSLSVQEDGFNEITEALKNGNIRLVYTGLAHPGAWTKAPEYFDAAALVPFEHGPNGLFFRHFPHDGLEDGQAIMAHDAVLTAVRAIRKVPQLEGPDEGLQRQAVMQMLTTLYDANAIAGASGYISVRNEGSPENKAIPVIEVDDGGRTRTVQVTSAGGHPYRPPGAPDAH